jgi:hypothetical protein
MRTWFRSHLTYANVMVTILAFVVLGGGTALAAYVVSSNSQIGPGTVAGHKPPSGKHANLIAGSINGQDIADRSGVDTCKGPLTAKFGPICAGGDGVERSWLGAIKYCSGFGLHLPSVSEAVTLAENYSVPGVPATGAYFWADLYYYDSANNVDRAMSVGEGGGFDGHVQQFLATTTIYTVCVTDPSA